MSSQPEDFQQLLSVILEKEKAELTEEEKEILREMINFWRGFSSVWSFISFITRAGIWAIITIGSMLAVWSQIKIYFGTGGN
jgi:hypothetical protein